MTPTGQTVEKRGLRLDQYRSPGDVWAWRLTSAPDQHWVQKVPGSGWWTTHVNGKRLDSKSTTFDNAVKALAKAIRVPA